MEGGTTLTSNETINFTYSNQWIQDLGLDNVTIPQFLYDLNFSTLNQYSLDNLTHYFNVSNTSYVVFMFFFVCVCVCFCCFKI